VQTSLPLGSPAPGVPGHLYKYKSLAGDSRKYTRDLIVSQRLYFPAPSDLNDPFECKPHLVTTATMAQQRRYLAGLVNRVHAGKPRLERRQLIREIGADRPRFRDTMLASTAQTLEATGIFSLSSRHLDLLMWPHYADNHRGVCVRLHVQTLMDAGHVPFPVTYADDRPACDTMQEETVDWLDKAVLTKGRPWEYEKEWRLVQNRGARTIVELTAPTIDGVLLGASMPTADREEVLQWVKASGRVVAVSQARFHPSSYKIEIEQVA
jgi:hypothetical protein